MFISLFFQNQCLSQGKIENFGRPYDLLKDRRTILHSLVFSLDKSEREKLIEAAKNVKDKLEKSVNFKEMDVSLNKSFEDDQPKSHESNNLDNETDELLSSGEKNN